MAKRTHLDRTFQQALQYSQQNRTADATKLYEQILGEDPGYTMVYHNLTESLMNLGKSDEALLRLQNAERKFPEDAYLLMAFGGFYFRSNNHKKARQFGIIIFNDGHFSRKCLCQNPPQ